MASGCEMDDFSSPPKEKCDSNESTNGNETESKTGNKRNKNMKNNQTKETTSTDLKSVNPEKEEDQLETHKEEESYNSDTENPEKKGSQHKVHETEGSDPINSDNPEKTDGQPQSQEKGGSDPLSSEQMIKEEPEQLSQDGKNYEAKSIDEQKTKRLEDDVVRLSNENETLKTTTKSLENDIKEREADIETFKSKIQELSKQHSKMKKCINEQELSLQNYKEDNEDKTKKIQPSEKDVERLRNENETLKSKTKSLENDIKEREVDIKTFRSKIEELHKQHRQANEKVVQLERDLTKRDDEIKNLFEASKMYEKGVRKQQAENNKRQQEVLEDKLKKINLQQNEIEDLKMSISDTKKQTDKTLKDYEKRQKKMEKDLQKEKEEHQKDLDNKNKLQDEKRRLEYEKNRLSPYEQTYHKIVKEVKSQQSKIESQRSTIDRYQNENESKRQKISTLEDEKETLLLRLSRITGAQLTYNNPNIADLSDDKRPTKLAEEFSELYDNEWTDAFECIDAENDDGKTKVLHDLLKKSYEFCEALSSDHDNAIRNSFSTLNYAKKLSEGTHDDLRSNTNNERRFTPTEEMNENKNQALLDVNECRSPTNADESGAMTAENRTGEKEKTGNTNLSVQGIEYEPHNEAESLNKTDRYQNEQQEKISKEKNKVEDQQEQTGDEKEIMPKQGTDSGFPEEVETKNKDDNKREEMYENTVKQNETIAYTNPPQQGIPGEDGNLAEADKKQEDQHDSTGDGKETPRQQGTASGFLEEVETNSKGDNNTDKMYVQTAQANETTAHSIPQQQDIEFGNPVEDGNFAETVRNERDQQEKTDGGKECPCQQGIKSGLLEEADSKNKADNTRKDLHGVTAEAKKTVEHRNPTQQNIEPGLPDEEVKLNTTDRNKKEQQGKTVQPTTSTNIEEDRGHAVTQTRTTDKCNDHNNGASFRDDCNEQRKYQVEIVKVSEVEFKFEDLTSEQKKTITDLRKVCEEKQTDDVVKEGSKLIAMEMRIENKNVMKYISKCIDICWSMRRHTPPVYIDFPANMEGLPLDTKLYRPYTKSGKLIHFVVWPVLYLHEGGPLLSKGVAQGQK